MKENEAILQRQKYNTRFHNSDMDFMFNWAIGISQVIGMTPSQVFYAVHGIKDGDPAGWRQGFNRQGDFLIQQAKVFNDSQHCLAAGQFSLGAAYAYRAALQYTDPTDSTFKPRLADMEGAFQQGVQLIGAPVRPIEVPFENTSLPGYYLEHDAAPRPALVMIGGGDTFREDLFYFAGYPGWKRGYNVLMVDLPGQGLCPERGLTFRADMARPISTVIDWLEANAAAKPTQIAVYGVSGGGYFSAQAAAADPRIQAWIASTPIVDMAQVFAREFGNVMKAPGWLMNLVLNAAGKINESAEINLRKYAWQFGTKDFMEVMDRLPAEAIPVDYTAIHCPSLFMMSEGEGPELRRQAEMVAADFRRRGVDVTLREFTAAEGADGHSQVNNLRLAHLVVFDWLDRVFHWTNPGHIFLV